MNKALLRQALEYYCRGWSIIPTRKKKAACPWKRYQAHRPKKAELRQLFSGSGIDGLAVVLGAVSGGLGCRDFDSLPSYRRWAKKYPRLAQRLPTVETGRGRHVYFGMEGKGKPFRDCGDGELRADSSHYCLLPPSKHPTGKRYRWLIPLPKDDLPGIDPYRKGLARRVTEQSEQTEAIGSVCALTALLRSRKMRKRVAEAIAATLPDSEGQRNRRIFDFARLLQAIPKLASVHPRALRPFVENWHKQALSVIGTQEFSATWSDFTVAWGRIKHPAGQGPIDQIFARAKKRKPSKMVAKYYPDEPKVILLAGLCRELQRVDPDADFRLDCRTAGRLLEVSHKTAAGWLAMFVIDGILELRETGSLETGRASRYRYLGRRT